MHTPLYQRFLRKAFGDEHDIVLVGHHFLVMPQTNNPEEDLKHLNEIPSADTALFDHELMGAVFGETAIQLMQRLASVPCQDREPILERALEKLDEGSEVAA